MLSRYSKNSQIPEAQIKASLYPCRLYSIKYRKNRLHGRVNAAVILSREECLSQYPGFLQFPQHWAYKILLQEKLSLKYEYPVSQSGKYFRVSSIREPEAKAAQTHRIHCGCNSLAEPCFYSSSKNGSHLKEVYLLHSSELLLSSSIHFVCSPPSKHHVQAYTAGSLLLTVT